MDAQEIHLRDYYNVLKKRKFTVFTFFIVTVTIVTIGTFTMTPIYRANTKILIEKNEVNPLDNYRFKSWDPIFLETQHQIIKSYNVARSVVRILSLDTKYASYFFPSDEGKPVFLKNTRHAITQFFSGLLEFVETSQDSAAKRANTKKGFKVEPPSNADLITAYLVETVEIKPVKQSSIIEVAFFEKNPVLAAMIANTFAKAYMDEVLEMNMSVSNRTIKWTKEKTDEERIKLEKSERKLQKYMRDNDIITVENKIAIIPQKLQQFSTNLSQATERRKELEEIVNKIKAFKNSVELETLSEFATNASLQDLREKTFQVDQTIEEMKKRFGRKHPKMIKAVSEREILLVKRDQEIRRIIKSKRNEYELAVSKVRNLKKLLSDTKKEALFLNERLIQHTILKREVDSSKIIYETLLQETKKQGLANQSQSINVWVVESAKAPQYPDSPQKKRNILLGFILGLFGGIGLAFFIEYLDNTVKSAADLEDRFGLTVLGAVSHYKEKGKTVERAVQLDSRSLIAESYKAIRTAILLSTAETPPRKLLITSMSPKEGKTTTSSNLATTISMNNQRVILIDCDLRKARVHKVLEVDNSDGLSTYLAGASEKVTVIEDSETLGYSFIPAGPAPPNPAELLNSDRFKSLITTLEQEYDFILLDSPPVMNVTDSLLLSKLVDGMIIVCRSGETNYDMLTSGLKLLNNIKAPILGCIINGIQKKDSGYYYSYESYYTTEAKN
jgi:polysaccharide biosynthesis transport protein